MSKIILKGLRNLLKKVKKIHWKIVKGNKNMSKSAQKRTKVSWKMLRGRRKFFRALGAIFVLFIPNYEKRFCAENLATPVKKILYTRLLRKLLRKYKRRRFFYTPSRSKNGCDIECGSSDRIVIRPYSYGSGSGWLRSRSPVRSWPLAKKNQF